MTEWKQTEEVLQEYRKLSTRDIWQKLLVYALIVTLAIVLLTTLILKILLLIYGKTVKLDFVLLAESGVVFVLGGIFGSFRTSITLSKASEKILKTEAINPVTIKSAINSVLTYIIMGTLLFIFSIIVSLTFSYWGYIIF
ncbi:MAG: hypothetical protein ACW99A_21195 [Candidatus Kariarchaeaceae archaeon]|jgi:hypothetical protein